MLAANPARASDADELRAFGLLGLSAVDCATPPGRDNPHAVFAVAAEGATYTWKSGPPELDLTSRVRAVNRLADDRIRMEIEGSNQQFIKVEIVKVGSAWHTDHSEHDGVVLVRDGALVDGGKLIARFHRCEGR
jgi:hypothetical protein